MPQIGYIEESKKTPQIRTMIKSAEKTGAPDPRVVSIMTRSEVGAAWVECWNKTLYGGVLPHKLKDVPHQNFSGAPVRLLLDRALQRRQGGRPYRGHDH